MEIWIPFLEAIHRVTRRVYMPEFSAKPLLREVVRSGRIAGRGEYVEKGDVILVFESDRAALDISPEVIREGSLYFKRELYPGEVRLDDLEAWVGGLADERLVAFSLQRPLNSPLEKVDGSAESVSRQPSGRRNSAHREAIEFAVAKLGDQLAGLTVERRDKAIQDFLRSLGRTTPSEKTIQRHFREKHETK